MDRYAMGNVAGFLLYAKTDVLISLDNDFIIGGNRISQKALDLVLSNRHHRNSCLEGGDILLSLFLGAGFSKWAMDLPLSHELFDFRIEASGTREQKKLEVVKQAKNNWDKSHPFGITEQFIADALNFKDKEKDAVLWYIVRRLSEPFIWKEFHAQRWRRHVLMIDENRKFGLVGINIAREFLLRCLCTSCGIITTNYDMVVEYVLGTKLFNYGILNQRLVGRGPYPLSQWKNPVSLKGKMPLAKIHGSVSWDEHGYYAEGRRGITGNALIVAPVPEKQPLPALKPAWKLAKDILKKSSRLIVFGYAFNPYDEAVIRASCTSPRVLNLGCSKQKLACRQHKFRPENAKNAL